jgi:acyl-coenzyme A synthetase/AMP-(fatty) acid ligase
MKRFSVLIPVLFLASSATAQIGQTMEQCAGLYGEPATVDISQSNKVICTFTTNALSIEIQFRDKKAAVICFSKKGAERFSERDFASLLAKNGPELRWRRRWHQVVETEGRVMEARGMRDDDPKFIQFSSEEVVALYQRATGKFWIFDPKKNAGLYVRLMTEV